MGRKELFLVEIENYWQANKAKSDSIARTLEGIIEEFKSVSDSETWEREFYDLLSKKMSQSTGNVEECILGLFSRLIAVEDAETCPSNDYLLEDQQILVTTDDGKGGTSVSWLDTSHEAAVEEMVQHLEADYQKLLAWVTTFRNRRVGIEEIKIDLYYTNESGQHLRRVKYPVCTLGRAFGIDSDSDSSVFGFGSLWDKKVFLSKVYAITLYDHPLAEVACKLDGVGVDYKIEFIE